MSIPRPVKSLSAPRTHSDPSTASLASITSRPHGTNLKVLRLVSDMSEPSTQANAVPTHAFAYVTFIVPFCALFSKTWIETSASGLRDVEKQRKEQHKHLLSHL